ncbi:MAG: heme-binding domain-containing protein, partial [Roseivirga sp.]|nr:heme-binding domain-containing protein [Roseivirga sp.]
QNDEVLKTDFFQHIEAPINIQTMVESSCYDCHSNNTNYPWYGRVRPFVWFLQKHIREGKDDLNFSTFQEYSGRMQREKIRSVISQLRDGKMPLEEYLWMHSEAKLSLAETARLIDFFENLNTQ